MESFITLVNCVPRMQPKSELINSQEGVQRKWLVIKNSGKIPAGKNGW